MKSTILPLLLSFCLTFNSLSYAQTDDSTVTELSTQEQLDQLLNSLSALNKTLKSNRRKRPVANKIKSITRKIIKAVNSTPPTKCLDILKIAMDDFFGLVSDLGSGISCGPPILPPFLPEGENIEEDLAINCIPPEPEELLRLQIGGPFGGAFADAHPVYNECRDVFQIDENGSNIPDVCE